jgi:hypothetical protein
MSEKTQKLESSKGFDRKNLAGIVVSTIFAVVTADALQNISVVFHQIGGKNIDIFLCNIYKPLGDSLLFDLKGAEYFFAKDYFLEHSTSSFCDDFIANNKATIDDNNIYFYFIAFILIIASTFFALLFVANTIRMLHGTLIDFDNDKNPAKTDIYPENIVEMIYIVLVLLSPSISLCFMERSLNYYWFLALYTAPSFAYFRWDFKLESELQEIIDKPYEDTPLIKSTSVQEIRRSEALAYIEYVKVWTYYDSLGILIFFVLLGLACFAPTTYYQYQHIRLDVYKIISTVIVFAYQTAMIYTDYTKNASFYFPEFQRFDIRN